MEKIIRWWTQFLIQLEAGKRIIAIFIVITICLSSALINVNNKYDKSKTDAIKSEKLHGQEIARIKDSASIDIIRLTTYYTTKIENIYKDQIESVNYLKEGYDLIKKKNEKVLKQR